MQGHRGGPGVGIGVVKQDLGNGLYLVTTEGGRVRKAWCVDLTPAPVGATVAMADVYNWNYVQNVLPVVNEEHPWGRKATNMWRFARELPAATCVMSYIRFKRWQRECPMFYYGVLTNVDYGADQCSVRLIGDKNQTLNKVPVQYMTCNAAPFSAGDDVVVEFLHGSMMAPRVIGFVMEPLPCDYIIFRDMRRWYRNVGAGSYAYGDMDHPGAFSGDITAGDLFKLNPASGRIEQLTSGLYGRNHDLDTKGEWIVFNRYNHPGDNPAVSPTGMSIWKIRTNGKDLTRVADRLYNPDHPEEVWTTFLHGPRWSKDSAQIAVPWSSFLLAWDKNDPDPERNFYYAGFDAGGVRYPALSWKAQQSAAWNNPPTETVFSTRINVPPSGNDPFLRYMVHQGQAEMGWSALRITPWTRGHNDLHSSLNPVNADRMLIERTSPAGEIMAVEDNVSLGAIIEYDPDHPLANEDGLRVIRAVDPPWLTPEFEETDDINWAWGYYGWPCYNGKQTKAAWDVRSAVVEGSLTRAIPGGIQVYDIASDEVVFTLGWGVQPCFWQAIYGLRPKEE